MEKLIFRGALILTIMGMSTFVAMAQTEATKPTKKEQTATSSMKVKCTKGACCGGAMLCCGSKAADLQKSLEGVEGVSSVKVNKKDAGDIVVEYTGKVKAEDLNAAAQESGFAVEAVTEAKKCGADCTKACCAKK